MAEGARRPVRWLSHKDGGRLPRSYAHGRDRPPQGTYSKPVAIAEAIIACYRWLGTWPTPWEYYEWAALQRAAARSAGKPRPLYPTRKPLHRKFETWPEALDVAQL